jgi:magnesium chelatase family protein
MYAAINSSTLHGVFGAPITVEVHIGHGLPGFAIVGQPDEACRESRDRVRAALLCSGVEWPNRRITVNLAGASEKRGGPTADLAIAVGVLVANGELPAEATSGTAFLGELGLDGSLRPAAGAAPLAFSAEGERVVVPSRSVEEARLGAGTRTVGAADLREVIAVLKGEEKWRHAPHDTARTESVAVPDLADVRGQPDAKFALEVAAAGFHHALMVGPPGVGKSMLAVRLPGILPVLDERAAFEVSMVRSAAGLAPQSPPTACPPFRAPHHTSSTVSIIGGGSPVRPGEVSLAHNGVLFLDEMGEFAPTLLDALRQPLEEGTVRIARARSAVELPARFLLVGASNPCPCANEQVTGCGCTPQMRRRYLRRFSGPLLDRFDVRIWLTRPRTEAVMSAERDEPTAVVAARVASARGVAVRRQGCPNALVPPGMIDKVAPVTGGARTVLEERLRRGDLTARGYHRVRRVARTVADLRGDDEVNEDHVVAAIGLRREMDRR